MDFLRPARFGFAGKCFYTLQVWAARVPGAAPGVPRPGCRVGRDAMEIHISSVSRAYLGSNLLVASSSARGAARQVWGVPLPGTRDVRGGTRGRLPRCRAARHPRCPHHTLKESWQAAWTVHRKLRPCPRAGCIPRPPGGGPVAIGLRSWGPPFTPNPPGRP